MYNEPSQEIDALARSVIGAAIEVHSILGPGFLESVYEEAMYRELRERGFNCVRQYAIKVPYKQWVVGEGYVDVLVNGRLPLELKTVDDLAPIHSAQLISYLKALKQPLGLLLNFRVKRMRDGIKRVVWSHP